MKLAIFAAAAALPGLVTNPAAADTSARVCASAQRATAGLDSRLPIDNTVHTALPSFVQAKPAVRPLRTHQYESATQIRCKGKSADHITSTYGSSAAAGEGTCAAINDTTLKLVARSLTTAERQRVIFDPAKVVIEADTLAQSGGEWMQDFSSTRVTGGVLHLRASALLVEWNDPRYQDLPPAFRGNHYCTLIAPSHLKRILRGDAPA